jgi:hypothetical protein
MIFKRKSIRRYEENLSITADEMEEIKQRIVNLMPLVKEVKVKFKIVEGKETTSKRGEYCLLMYSEQKPLYLLNAGYMLEQIDLFLASRNIGTCWYALAKTKELTLDDLDYVIMLAFGKSHSEDFRKDFSKTNRKDLETIWKGEHYLDIGEIVRYAPSACNTQPWRVVSEDNCLRIYRTTQIKSFMPASKLSYYNSIDMGIFICFLDITLSQKGYMYERSLSMEKCNDSELIDIATYNIE